MKLQPHYFCPRGVKPPRPSRRPRVRTGDVKTCYVRIRRRWTRVGTLCRHCREFVPDLRQPPGKDRPIGNLTVKKV